MGLRGLLEGLALATLGLGGAAIIRVGPNLFPNHVQLLFWLGVSLVGSAVSGIAALIIWTGKKEFSNDRQLPPAIRIGSIEDSTFSDIDVTGEQAFEIGRAKRFTVEHLKLRKPNGEKGSGK